MHTHLEQRRPEENRQRFYALDLGRDLFGARCVTRNWGRIGTLGQRKIDSFDTAHAARLAFKRLEVAKRRRGYADPAQ